MMNINFPKTSNALLLSAALFCAGLACGWLMRGGKYGKLKYYAVGGGNYWVE